MNHERTIIYPSCPNGGAVPCYCLACAPETTRLHRAEAATGTPETAAEYCVRTFAEALDRYKARCLRAESFARACRSAAAIHCATSDRRDYHADPAYCKHCDDKDLLAADTRRLPQEAIRAITKGYHETDTDAR